MREHLLGIALNHIAVELSTTEVNRRFLQRLLFRRQFKIHRLFSLV